MKELDKDKKIKKTNNEKCYVEKSKKTFDSCETTENVAQNNDNANIFEFNNDSNSSYSLEEYIIPENDENVHLNNNISKSSKNFKNTQDYFPLNLNVNKISKMSHHENSLIKADYLDKTGKKEKFSR
ncbi:hypothetical protein EDEG_01497 [Edhazardia aedis USNM 41457]|uniref:Uncharacterized protein n=1 Tax=Edhazardia aedis (strain USNM 41457) TaxID=1003232 RepID=J9D8X8_EDHAE|nr:hypothetical protein EDEG_01497 [Edhazardia aedis USNM 41457]|eukprot:EJW04216.1 hypothetical protein EDEG_01497 [Edhazardia aedis USNM 41457]